MYSPCIFIANNNRMINFIVSTIIFRCLLSVQLFLCDEFSSLLPSSLHFNWYHVYTVYSSYTMSTKDLLITQREDVRKAFGKSEKDVEKDIEIVRDWIKTQPHLPEIPNDQIIETFLVTNKFSIERAKPKLDMYYTIRSLIPDLYKNTNPTLPRMKKAAKMSLSCLLPKLTKDLYRVYMFKIVADPDDFNFIDVIGYLLNMFEVRIQEDTNMGDVYIIDHVNLKMGHVTKMTPTIIKKVGVVLEKVFSNRVKGMHIINYPPYVDILVNIAKAVLKPKLVRRIHLHSNLDELHQYVDKNTLPSDYGGEEASLQELSDLWELKVEEYSDRLAELEKMKIKEELRPEPLTNDEVLGFHGNFKKLDVD